MKYLVASALAIVLLIFISTFSPDPEIIPESSNPTETEVGEIEQEPQLAQVSLPEILETPAVTNTEETQPTSPLYQVVRVVDGDTIDVMMDSKIERLRLIGINTPETMDPRKPVECFGREASDKAKELLSGKRIRLETDLSQGELDKYSRLLRYVFLEDGTNFNLTMTREGYAYEYTYDGPYTYQTAFKAAQKYAESNKLGLWGETCGGKTSASAAPTNTSPNSCTIKGNISSNKEKIFHVLGCGSYDKTIIDESVGERWFCSEQDALDAGWRKAKNC